MNFIEHIEYYDGVSSYAPHSHIYCEIIYVADGSIEIITETKTYQASKGDTVLIPVGIVHSTRQSEQAYRRWLMFISPWNFSKAYSSPGIQGMITGMIYREPLTANAAPFGESVMNEIHREYTSKKPLRDELLSSYVLYMLACVYRQNITQDQISISDSAKTVMAIQAYIQQNCSTGLQISQAAKAFSLSKYHLTHLFKKHVGISPKKFLLSCRLSMAEQILRNEQTGIAEISERCGFASPSDMAVRFRREYGCAPNEYRLRLTQTAASR